MQFAQYQQAQGICPNQSPTARAALFIEDDNLGRAVPLLKAALPPRSALEAYDVLCESAQFRQLAESICPPTLTRLRMDFPRKTIKAKWLDKLNAQQVMWLERINHYSEKEPRASEMTLHELFEIVLSAETLTRYHDSTMQSFKGDEDSLSAVTFRKGLYDCTGASFSLCGKSLSGVCEETRKLVSTSLSVLADKAIEWKQYAALDLCAAETKMLAHNASAATMQQSLTSLYFLLLTEKFWFEHTFNGASKSDTMSLAQLTRGTGFCYFASAMGRPVTRPEVWPALKTHDFEGKLCANTPFTLYVSDHKTSSSFRTLVMDINAMLSSILSVYSRKIRPGLMSKKAWARVTKTCFFLKRQPAT